MKNNFSLLLLVLLLFCKIAFSQEGEVFVKSQLPIPKTIYNKALDALFFNKYNKNEIHLSSFNNTYSTIFNGLGFAILDYDISKNGKYLVTANKDESITVWQVKPKKNLHKFAANQGVLQNICFFDNNSFFSLGKNGKLKKWNIKGQLLYEINASNIALNVVSKFDDKIVVGGYDNILRIIDDNKKNIEFEINIGEIITSLLVNKEQNIIYAGDCKGTLHIINILSKKTRTIDLHESIITDMCLVENKYLVSSSWDRKIKITNIDSFKILKNLIGHKDYIFSLTLRDKELFSSSRDKTIRRWILKL
ncbi:WD40 repeat domain-containing protein [Aquimarina muelleri]|uniref:WD40 repeat domain-containing protein n=1 Tax=Aquimarina muelleri TaxID=279356 RepID=UPI003F684EA7